MVSLHNYSLRQKLILFAILPIIMLGVFGIIRAWGLHQEFNRAHRNAMAIQVTNKIGDLIYELQKERGLSLNWLSDHPSTDTQALEAQQSLSDLHYRNLMQSEELKKLLVGLSHNDRQLFNHCLTNIKSRANSLKLVRKALLNKTYLENSAFFNNFNDFNDELLLLVNQIQHQTNDADQSRGYSDLLLAQRIQELAARERGLLSNLLSSDTLALNTLQPLEALIQEQLHAIKLAEDTFDTDHRHLMRQFESSLPSQQAKEIRSQLAEQRHISQLAWELSATLGYGGLIHHFKNFLLRGNEGYATKFYQDWKISSRLLTQLENSKHLHHEQRQALADIRQSMMLYHTNLLTVRELRAKHMPVQQLDELVKVNDTPMIKGLERLKYPAPPVTAGYWQVLATERIAMLHDLGHHISRNIEELSRHQMRMALLFISIYSLAAAVTLLVSLLLGRKIIASFMGKIESIASDMQQMADDPKLELVIKTKGSDEIARMAESMNKMLKERKKYRQELGRAAAVFEYSAEGIMVTDADNHIEMVNPAFSQITGYSLADVKGRNPSILSSHRNSPQLYDCMWESLRSTDKWEGEIWNRRKDGQVFPEYLAITLVRDDEGHIVQHIGLFMDISRRKQYEQDIWYKANFDALTDLPNRKLLSERLEHEIKMAQRESRKLAVMVLDLDRFKFINDTQGHESGDLLLKAVSERLQKVLGTTDFLARIGGDEFVIVLPRLAQEQTIEQQAKHILIALGKPFTIKGFALEVSASLGVGIYPQDGPDVETLLGNAETALYGAKDDGRGRFKYFTPEMNQAMVARLAMEQALKRAVSREEFLLHYQPVIDIRSGKVTALEALIRWQDPDKGLIAPAHFIPVAEEMGLMSTIGEWVLDRALGDLAKLHAMGHSLSMAVNVSACQCDSKGSCIEEQLRSTLSRHGVAPRHLHVEITESMLMDNTNHCQETLNHIRDLGCAIYLDDFGTGYSSLSYLKKFPISVIKIDKSFVEQLPDCESDANLIRAIVHMGKSLGMRLVAEGIETEEQLAFLQMLGSDYGQGYHISRPLPFDELTRWIENRLTQHSNPWDAVNP
ncbi:EAL domain-containing protein [Shewanella sp.]|uniref:EAL domain-containing protein n=1 Tax=Shewanella sp. TaxID=50422 RepID=UPI003569134F